MEFYRYEAREYAEMDYDGEYVSSDYPNPRLRLLTFNLHKETLKGHWIGFGNPSGLKGSSKWVSKTGMKRYAYPTKEKAMSNYILRTEKRVKILKRQITSCEIALRFAKAKNDLELAKK